MSDVQQDTLRSLLEPLVGKDGPGVALGIYENGELVASATAGLAVVEHDVPITVDTMFDIASVSKQVTATCLLLLARDGRLDLDADIRGYLPELSLAPAVTLRQCLTHTAGLRDLYAVCDLAGIPLRGMREPDALKIIRRQRDVDFPPGSQYSYSNTGYVIAAAVVRAVTGAGLAAYAAEHVFGPLGADVTRFRDDVGTLVPHLAAGYVADGDTFRRFDVTEEVVGDGAVVTSLADYAAWQRFMATGDVLGEDIRDALRERPGPGFEYALGLHHHTLPGGEDVWSHSGSWAGYRAGVVYLPASGRGVAAFANRDDRYPYLLATAVAHGLATGEDPAEVLAGFLGRPATPEISAAARERVVDLWHEPDQDQFLSAYAADDGLLAADDDGEAALFRYGDDGSWHGINGAAGVTFTLDDDTALVSTAATTGEVYARYARVGPDATPGPAPRGTYRSGELDLDVVFGDLSVTFGDTAPRTLMPAGPDVWRGEGLTVRRDGDDLLASAPGARRMRLVPAVARVVAPPRLDPRRLARLDEVIGHYVGHGDVAGAVAVVERGGDTHVTAIGALSRDPGAAHVTEDTIFRISSMTKPILAAAAMTLVEECRLLLDEPIDPWIPELANRHVLRRLDAALDDVVNARRPITVRDLLTFRMGFGQIIAAPDAYPILAVAHANHIGMGPPDPDTMPPPEEWLRRLGSLPLMFQPGERWMYHTSADVLGVLLARVCGRPLGDVLRMRIFEPLGMVDTGFSVRPESMDRFATAYTADVGNGHLLYDLPGGAWSREPAFPSGGGGLVSTARDFLAFARMMRTGGAPVLSPASVDMMTTDHLTEAQKAVSGLLPESFTTAGWGFGMGVTTVRDQLAGAVGAYGWDGGLGSVWRNDPRADATMLLFTQQMWSSPRFPPIVRDFFTSAYAAFV